MSQRKLEGETGYRDFESFARDLGPVLDSLSSIRSKKNAVAAVRTRMQGLKRSLHASQLMLANPGPSS